MSLKGNLQSVDLANVLQMLSINQKEGSLVLFDGDTRKSIYFSKDGVSMLSRGRKGQDSLGRILLRYGVINADQLREALDKQAAEGKRLGEVLQEMGAATDADVQNAIRTQIEEEIYNLFIWKEASFEFVEGPPPEAQNVPAVVTFNVNSLIMEAQRRADEWNYIRGLVPSLDEIYRPTDKMAEAQVTDEVFHLPFAPRVLENIQQGRMNIHELIEQSCAAKFEACKILAILLEQGSIEPVSIAELQSLAAEATGRGDHAQAAKFLSRIVDLGGATPPVNMSLGYALEALDEPERASIYLKAAAEAYAESMEPSHAFEAYIRVARALPTDLAAVSQMVETACNNESILGTHRHEVIEAGRVLAQCQKELGRLPAALQILHKLAQVSPQDLPLRGMLSQAYQDSGMNAEAMAELEAMADACAQQKNYDEAIRYLRRITAIDRNRAGVSKKIDLLTKSRDSGKRFMLRVVSFASVIAVVAGVAFGIWKYLEIQKRHKKELDAKVSASLDPIKSRFNQALQEFKAAREALDRWSESAVATVVNDLEAANRAIAALEKAQKETEAQANSLKIESGSALEDDFVEKRVSGLKQALVEATSARSQVLDEIVQGASETYRKARKDGETRPLAQIPVLKKVAGLLDAAGSEGKVTLGGKIEDVKKYVEQFETYATTVTAKQKEADALYDAGEMQKGHLVLIDFLALFSTVEEFREVLLFQVRVTTTPAGALVKNLDPALADAGAAAPRRLKYTASAGLRLRVTHEGFEAVDREVAPLAGKITRDSMLKGLPSELHVVLRKVPAWSLDLQSGALEAPPAATPDGAHLVVNDRAGVIHLVSVGEGKEVGRYDARSLSGFQGAPLVTADSVYNASADGVVVALDLPSLRERWRPEGAEGPGACYGSPVLAGDLLVAAGAGGVVKAWHARTGTLAWERSGASKLPYGARKSLVFVRGWIVAFCEDGRLRVLGQDGRELIEVLPAKLDSSSFPPPQFGPLPVADKVLVGLQGSGQEFAFIALPLPGGSSPHSGHRWGAVADGTEVAGAVQEGEDLLLLFANGTLRRVPYRVGPGAADLPIRVLDEKERPLGSPALRDGTLFVDSERTLLALRIEGENPRELWKWFAPEGTVISTPVLLSGRYVFVCTKDGRVHALLKD